jgi:small-conductance mechanosensitive channel
MRFSRQMGRAMKYIKPILGWGLLALGVRDLAIYDDIIGLIFMFILGLSVLGYAKK